MNSSVNSELKKSCNQESCNVATNGKCLEGLEMTQCPHFFYLNNYDTIEDKGNSNKIESFLPLLNLSSGDALELAETTTISHKHKPILIIILGESDSGKTTLSATIHELFQRAPFNNFWFAGSITPIGFEKRCHFSRVVSGSLTPNTEKTKVDEFQYLHLAVKHETRLKDPAHHLFLSDVSGELFKLARNSSETMKALTIVKSAYRIILTLDGEKLANKKLRNAVLVNTKIFIKKALEEKVFDNSTRLDLVVTKWDILQKVNDFSIDEAVDSQLHAILANSILEFNLIKIAARPSKPVHGIPLGYGLKELLDLWLKTSEKKKSTDILNNLLIGIPNTSGRQFISMLSYMFKQDTIE